MMWDSYDNGSWGMHDGMGVAGWLVMGLALLLLTAMLVGLLVALLRVPRNGTGGALGVESPSRTADQMLAERFARGEIDDEEYGHRLAVLHAH